MAFSPIKPVFLVSALQVVEACLGVVVVSPVADGIADHEVGGAYNDGIIGINFTAMEVDSGKYPVPSDFWVLILRKH